MPLLRADASLVPHGQRRPNLALARNLSAEHVNIFRDKSGTGCTPSSRCHLHTDPQFLRSSIDARGADENPKVLAYEGTWNSSVKRVKLLSLTSCLLTSVGAPIVALLGGEKVGLQAAMACTVVIFGVTTTGMLHWFTGPYVHKLWHDADRGEVTLETLSVFAKPECTRFALTDVQIPTTIHPLASFSVGDRVFYVDEELFADKALLAKLCPQSDFSRISLNDGSEIETNVTEEDENYWAELEAQEAEDEIRRQQKRQ